MPSALGEARAATQITEHLDWAPVVVQALVDWPSTFRAWSDARVSHAPPPAIPILLSKQSFLI